MERTILEGFSKEAVQERLSLTSTLEEVIATYLGVYNITYTTPAEVLEQLNLIIMSKDYEGRNESIKKFSAHFDSLAKANDVEDMNALMIEDMFLSGYGGMLRIFTNDVSYLWLTFLIDCGGSKWENPTLSYIGAAISCYDQPQSELLEPVQFDGEEEPRFLREDKASIWYQTNFGTKHVIEFKETMYDGIFNSMHIQVVVDGQEAGYYFSY
jgi:hypothetical protein